MKPCGSVAGLFLKVLMTGNTLTQEIKEKALELGFTMAGVSSTEALQSINQYQQWIKAGHHAEMAYLSGDEQIDKRSDPKKILPECKSILVLAIPYSKPIANDSQSEKGNLGRVAAYAYGDDYHEILKFRLQAIVDFIEGKLGHSIPNRYYTDTGPILERELGQRAGLGWIAKNSMLIHPKVGSYFLIAEILLGIELDSDAAFQGDLCGSCTRCIDACPTDCILPNRTLDAGRCLSYLTIELKGPVPMEMREDIKDWVFGCDICQEVCPWNIRFAPEHGDLAFMPRPDVPSPILENELSLTAETFNKKFKGSPVKRAKRRGYLRNTALALGNAKKATSIPSLAESLQNDPEALVRAHAAWALGRIQETKAEMALQNAQKLEIDKDVLLEIKLALGQFD